MPVLEKPVESHNAWARTTAQSPLDETVWQAWVAKGRAQDRRGSASRIKAVKWASIAGLLGAACPGYHLAPFEPVVRFLVTAGAMFVMFQAFQVRHYAIAAAFAILALFYNPVVPVFGFSGDWQRAVVAASALPFVASVAWPMGRNGKTGHNG